MSFSADDHRHMARALQLAARGLETTTPNPRVGCVLVRDGVVIGEGWHARAGGPHAEIAALAAADPNYSRGSTAVDDPGAADATTQPARGRFAPAIGGAPSAASGRYGSTAVRGATAYVTLEPCAHHGRTGPCADALIAAGVARVVAAMVDPNPLVAGQGLERLRSNGVSVSGGLMEAAARELNVGFVARMTRGRPWLRLKLAISLDGKTALANGRSQWITGADARRDAHRWRARSCAVLTGFGTVRDDNPRLTVRDVPALRQPLRVVVDSRLETPVDAAVLAGGGTLIYGARDDAARRAALMAAGAEVACLPNAQGKVDLPAMLADLARRGVNEVLVEAGAQLNASLLREGCVDELLIYQAPLLLGDVARGAFAGIELTELTQAARLDIVERRAIGSDTFLRARLAR